MNECVLFSPLGMTDPTRGCRDGGFIHICRLYRPQKVYLYMSKEICDFDSQDNRYEEYLKRLCEKLNFECTVKKIMRPDLIYVNDFDAFYSDFTTIIKDISLENPDCEILINLSSGTPQMKSALKIVSSLSPRHLIQLQVSSPVKKSNHEKFVDGDYDIELEWELNLDNGEDSYEDRCTIVKSENFNAHIKNEIITKHIKVYDYKAALTVAQTIPDFVNPRAMKLIMSGERRLELDVSNAEMYARSVGYDLIPIKEKLNSSNKGKIAFEYLLMLKIKLNKGGLADFVRAVSPVLTDMFELYLENKCNIDIESYYTGKQKAKLSRSLLPPDLLQVLDQEYASNRGYEDMEPCAANLYPLVVAKGDSKAREIATKLRSVEQKARNIAAHEIVAVTEAWLKARVGFGSQDVFTLLKDFLTLSIAIPRNAWDSYECLNETIIAMPILK